MNLWSYCVSFFYFPWPLGLWLSLCSLKCFWFFFFPTRPVSNSNHISTSCGQFSWVKTFWWKQVLLQHPLCLPLLPVFFHSHLEKSIQKKNSKICNPCNPRAVSKIHAWKGKDQEKQGLSVWAGHSVTVLLFAKGRQSNVCSKCTLWISVSNVLQTHIQLSILIAAWSNGLWILTVQTFWLCHWICCTRFQSYVSPQTLGADYAHGLVYELGGSEVLKNLFSWNVPPKIYTMQIIWKSFPNMSFHLGQTLVGFKRCGQDNEFLLGQSYTQELGRVTY